ncbi:hypothetical protein [Burkholderia glumae]|uniref:hypothetical protein n=1 Tax=Burkholderia glumae TaxID=337 RepID=UPI0021511EC3|nr:hypothetical protein [Burkholderia glumae]
MDVGSRAFFSPTGYTFSGVRRKPSTGKVCGLIRTRFVACVMSVLFQGEILMTIRDQQLSNATAA